MQYLTFEQYQAIGGTLDSTAFNRNVVRANGVIDAATHKRVEAMQTVPDAVKALCRDLTEFFASHSDTGATVTSRSQSAGSVSESESYATLDADGVKDAVDAMCCDYLLAETDDNGTPLLYRGASA